MESCRGRTESWVVARLEDVCVIDDSRRVPVNQDDRTARIVGRSVSELYPYYGATGMVGWIDGYIFEGEHVLLGEDGAPFLDRSRTKAYVVTGRYWVNNHAHVLQALIDSRFLAHFLNQFDYHGFVTGTTRLKLNQAAMRSIPVLVPPLVEQRAIATKIDALFSELDKGVEQLQTIKQQLKQYRQAILKAAFEGRLTAAWRAEQQAAGTLSSADELLEQIRKEREAHYEQQIREWKQAITDWEADGGKGSRCKKPRRPTMLQAAPPFTDEEWMRLPQLPANWAWVRFRTLAREMCLGKMLDREKNKGVARPYLRNANVRWYGFDLDDLNQMRFEPDEEERYGLKDGDLVICEGGEPGRAAVWGSPISSMMIQKALHRVRLLPGYRGLFALHFLRHASMNGHLGHYFTGTTIKHLPAEGLEIVPFPLCSAEEQAQINDELESRLCVLDELDKAVDQGLERAQVLRQSILKKASEGRLLSEAELAAVRTDPEYEPADKLLERIRAEKGLHDRPSPPRRSRRESKPTGPSRLRGNTAEAGSEAR
jgi:type I restriction enzyme S subunit